MYGVQGATGIIARVQERYGRTPSSSSDPSASSSGSASLNATTPTATRMSHAPITPQTGSRTAAHADVVDEIDWDKVDTDSLERDAIASSPASSQKRSSQPHSNAETLQDRLHAAAQTTPTAFRNEGGKRKREEDEAEVTPKRAVRDGSHVSIHRIPGIQGSGLMAESISIPHDLHVTAAPCPLAVAESTRPIERTPTQARSAHTRWRGGQRGVPKDDPEAERADCRAGSEGQRARGEVMGCSGTSGLCTFEYLARSTDVWPWSLVVYHDSRSLTKMMHARSQRFQCTKPRAESARLTNC